MKVKDQLKVRREQLGISVNELAKRLGVSAQAVRHWENGRSFPGKSKTAALETALSFNIDWTEGARAAAQRPQAASLIDPNDVELLLKIARLPPPAKALFGSLVDLHLDAMAGGKPSISERIKESPARPFRHNETTEEISRVSAGKVGAAKGKATPHHGEKATTKRHPARRKAA